jgi:hypothetical protein
LRDDHVADAGELLLATVKEVERRVLQLEMLDL